MQNWQTIDTAVRKSKLPLFFLLALLIIISYFLLTSYDDLKFAYLTSEKYSTNNVCGQFRDIEKNSSQNSKLVAINNYDFEYTSSKYKAGISASQALLTITNLEGDFIWWQADLSSAFIDGCDDIFQPTKNITLQTNGNQITIQNTSADGLKNEIHFTFNDAYILYYPETEYPTSQGLAGQNFLTGVLGGAIFGMINPDPLGEVRDGIFNDFSMPPVNDLYMRNSIGHSGHENDYLNFSPTTDAWYVTNNNQVLIHGLAGLNPADGISLKIPKNNKNLSIHYANISSATGIKANEPKQGVPAIIAFFNSDNLFNGFQEYYLALEKENIIPTNKYQSYDWWTKGIYCTWFESHDLTSPQPDKVYAALDKIESADVSIGTIIIDEGWAGKNIYGDWEYDPDIYTGENGFRGFIDDLHSRGYKVILHFMPFTVNSASTIYKKHKDYLVNGHFDYTNSEFREYMGDVLRILLSDDPDAYNADGLKVDFIQHFNNSADFTSQYHDSQIGRGGDYLHFALKWLYDTSKQIKPDAFISGFGVHPLFQDTFDAIRTGDLGGPVVPQGLNRIVIKHILMPQVYSIYDMPQNQHWNFKAAAYGYATSIPHVIFKTEDGFSGDYSQLPAISQEYDLVRHNLIMKNLDITSWEELQGINDKNSIIWQVFNNGSEVRVTDNNGQTTILNNFID
ncbi:alpha-galactosidase [Patescibacteria group bacterium]|nr:alpha-galactosidase [Patescibacteria group bacterium]MBU0964275.1 alpha-galactosidase [Patescibacteria group bacterium]